MRQLTDVEMVEVSGGALTAVSGGVNGVHIAICIYIAATIAAAGIALGILGYALSDN